MTDTTGTERKRDPRLNDTIAVTVVILTVFLAICKVKDDNINQAVAAKQAAEYEADIKKYEERSKETRAKAEALEKEYDRLNSRDDQFDASEAFISIAIALAAVAALVDLWWLVYLAWGSGAIGIIFGLAGFAGIALRAQWLVTLLGT